MHKHPMVQESALRVLVVDDDRTNRLWTSHLVKQCGHIPLLAESGHDAVQQCEANDVDVVLMDVLMPGMSGFYAASLIKALYSERWVPIVFLSGLNEKGARDDWTEVGDDFLSKPVDPQLLTAKLRSLSVAVGHEAALRRVAHDMEREQQLARKLIETMGFQFNRVDWPWLEVFNSEMGIGSGDCLAIEKTDSRVVLMVADATGHGLSAAVTLIPAVSAFRAMVLKGFGVAEIAEEVNRKLRAMLPRDRFVATLMVDIDCAARAVTVLNAGMPPGVLLSVSDASVTEFGSVCPPLGVQGRLPYADAVVRHRLDQERQNLLLFSDGFSESYQGMSVTDMVQQACHAPGEGSLGDRLWSECLARVPRDDATLVRVDLDTLLRPRAAFGSVRLTARRLKQGPVSAGDVLDALAEQGWLNVQHDTKLVIVLSELLSNAIEHGVLRLPSVLKEQANGLELYEQERRQRLAMLERGFVEIRLRRLDEESVLELEVTDSGSGFDTALNLPVADGALPGKPGLSGRGLNLLSHLCQRVSHSQGGSRVTVWITMDELF